MTLKVDCEDSTFDLCFMSYQAKMKTINLHQNLALKQLLFELRENYQGSIWMSSQLKN